MMPPPYRHPWRKPLTAKAKDRLAVLLLLWVAMFLGAVWHFAGQAHGAPTPQRDLVITVEVSWRGCADLTAPDLHDQDQVVTALVCQPPTHPATYVVRPGQMYGAAVFAPGQPVMCRVSVSGHEVRSQAAIGAVNCLARL